MVMLIRISTMDPHTSLGHRERVMMSSSSSSSSSSSQPWFVAGIPTVPSSLQLFVNEKQLKQHLASNSGHRFILCATEAKARKRLVTGWTVEKRKSADDPVGVDDDDAKKMRTRPVTDDLQSESAEVMCRQHLLRGLQTYEHRGLVQTGNDQHFALHTQHQRVVWIDLAQLTFHMLDHADTQENSWYTCLQRGLSSILRHVEKNNQTADGRRRAEACIYVTLSREFEKQFLEMEHRLALWCKNAVNEFEQQAVDVCRMSEEMLRAYMRRVRVQAACCAFKLVFRWTDGGDALINSSQLFLLKST